MARDELMAKLRSISGETLGREAKQAAAAIEELTRAVALLESDRDAERTLREDAESKISRWIPVTERLPNPFVNVLVCFDFKGRKSIDVAELWSDDGVFHNYSDEYLTPDGRKYRRGTHWMPLPEPPKEET